MRIISALLLVLFVSSCGSVGSTLGKAAVNSVLGSDGGPSLDAQVGKTNQRNIGVSDTKQSQVRNISGGTVNQDNSDSRVSSDRVDKVEINEFNPWLIILLVLGWLAPSPGEMSRWIRGLFKRKKE